MKRHEIHGGSGRRGGGNLKATITRALKSGKISGIKDDSGAWIIDPAELHRVFPPVADEPSETRIMQQPATHEKPNETGLLERENQMLREALAEARQERDRWHQIAERLSIAPPAPAPGQPGAAVGFWSRLFGKGRGAETSRAYRAARCWFRWNRLDRISSSVRTPLRQSSPQP